MKKAFFLLFLLLVLFGCAQTASAGISDDARSAFPDVSDWEDYFDLSNAGIKKITSAGNYYIQGTGADRRIDIDVDGYNSVNVYLNNASLDASKGDYNIIQDKYIYNSPINILGTAPVNLYFKGTCVMKSGSCCAVIHKENKLGLLTIRVADSSLLKLNLNTKNTDTIKIPAIGNNMRNPLHSIRYNGFGGDNIHILGSKNWTGRIEQTWDGESDIGGFIGTAEEQVSNVHIMIDNPSGASNDCLYNVLGAGDNNRPAYSSNDYSISQNDVIFSINFAYAPFVVSGGMYDYQDGVLCLTEAKSYDISMRSGVSNTDFAIRAENAGRTTVNLNNVSINCAGLDRTPLSADVCGDVTWNFSGANRLIAGNNRPALAAQPDQGKTTTVYMNADSSLYAQGGADSPGIGGEANLVIEGYSSGTVEARGGANGAGIGSGKGDGDNGTFDANQIIIRRDVHVTGIGGDGAAGIGGGVNASVRSILLEGSSVVSATGGVGGAGVGSGKADGGATYVRNIVIRGSANVTAQGGEKAAGIGDGQSSLFGSITLDGECIVTAAGGKEGTGVGGAYRANGDLIKINSCKRVTAMGGDNTSDIGYGSIRILGGTVEADVIGGMSGDYGYDLTIDGGNILSTELQKQPKNSAGQPVYRARLKVFGFSTPNWLDKNGFKAANADYGMRIFAQSGDILQVYLPAMTGARFSAGSNGYYLGDVDASGASILPLFADAKLGCNEHGYYSLSFTTEQPFSLYTGIAYDFSVDLHGAVPGYTFRSGNESLLTVNEASGEGRAKAEGTTKVYATLQTTDEYVGLTDLEATVNIISEAIGGRWDKSVIDFGSILMGDPDIPERSQTYLQEFNQRTFQLSGLLPNSDFQTIVERSTKIYPNLVWEDVSDSASFKLIAGPSVNRYMRVRVTPKTTLSLGDHSFEFYGLTVKCRVVAEREQSPTGIQVKNETVSGKKDGALIGVTDKMEWSADGTTWNVPNQNAPSGLAPGTYFVRTKSTDTKAASLPVQLTIGSGGKLSVKFIYFDGTLAEDLTCDYGEQITQTPALPAVNGYHDPSWDMLLPYTVRADEIRYASYQPNDGLQKADKPENIWAQDESYPGARDGLLINLTNAMEWSADGGASWHRPLWESPDNLPAGKYLVRTAGYGGDNPRAPSDAVVVYVGSNAAYTVLATITKDGQALTGLQVRIYRDDGQTYTLNEDAGGKYSYSIVTNGEYELYIEEEPSGFLFTVLDADKEIDVDFFTISFEANGGLPVPVNQVILKDGLVTAPVGVTKGDDALEGWYADNTLTTPWNFASDTVTATRTLYAKWILFVPVTDITGLPTAATVGIDLTLSGVVTPTDATNQTIVWSVQSAGTTGATIEPGTSILKTSAAGTATLRATIADGIAVGTDYVKDFDVTVSALPMNQYTLTLTAEPTNGGTVTGGGTYDENANVTATAQSAAGFRFVKWIEGGVKVSGDASYAFAMTQNRALTAVFEAIANPPASGNRIDGIAPGQRFDHGVTVSFTAHGSGMDNQSPKAGDMRWRPSFWSVNPSGTFDSGFAQRFSTAQMTAGRHTLNVTFTKQRYDGAKWADIAPAANDVKSVDFSLITTPIPPVTGDGHNPVLWLSLCLFGAFGILIVARMPRKRR